MVFRVNSLPGSQFALGNLTCLPPEAAIRIIRRASSERLLSPQLEEARAEAGEVLRINPGFTIERYKRLVLDKDPKDVQHRLDGLRKAGLPES